MTPIAIVSDEDLRSRPIQFSRFPGLRALTWSGNSLYSSRGYELLRGTIKEDSGGVDWQIVGTYTPSWRRKLSARNRLSSRLFRDGFHALAILPAGSLVAAVPGAIITLRSNESRFRRTHSITRGTRPLHITQVPGGTVFWGEYFDNASRDEVHIYASSDAGETWNVAYTFSKGAIRHVHNIVYDRWANCLWVLTGDYGEECRILRASCDFSSVETVVQGRQQVRSAAAIPVEDGLYFSSDTPLESNFIYRLDRQGNLAQLSAIGSSSIYGCQVGSQLFFSTMVEPSEVNEDSKVRVYRGDLKDTSRWLSVLEWQKDRWPIGLFQYGNAFLPDGNNSTHYLALTTVAVKSDDTVTFLYNVGP